MRRKRAVKGKSIKDHSIFDSGPYLSFLQKMGDYWSDLSKLSSQGIDIHRFWHPIECSERMMSHAYEIFQSYSKMHNLKILQTGSFSLAKNIENRYLQIQWEQLSVVFIYDFVDTKFLVEMKNISEFFQENDMFIVLLASPPGIYECRVASDLRDSGQRVILMSPVDFYAIITFKWSIEDLIKYKLFRIFLLGKKDIEGVFEKFMWRQFKCQLKRLEKDPPEINLKNSVKNIGIEISELLIHPFMKSLQKTLSTENFLMIYGDSSSGKTSLAVKVAHDFQTDSGRDVWYFDLSTAQADDNLNLGVRLLDRSFLAKELILILDDLQTNPDMAKQIFLFLKLLRSLGFNQRLIILGISWPDLKPELEHLMLEYSEFTVTFAQLSGPMIKHFGSNLKEEQIKKIEDTVGNDLYLLKLNLSYSNMLKRALTPNELAKDVWEEMISHCKIDSNKTGRVVLTSTLIGQYECEVTKEFLTKQTEINVNELDEIVKTKLIRYHKGKINAGHRSFCALLTNYLKENQGYWKWFEERNKANSPEKIVIDFIFSMTPSQVWPILKAIHNHVGFKTKGGLDDGFSLADYWQNVDYLLEKLVNQQKIDPTWGQVPSSAMFAIEGFSALGLYSEAKTSLNFLRDSYWINDDGLFVKVRNLGTVYDFEQIKKRMKSEDLSKSIGFGSNTIPFEAADEINEDLFHENWVRGLILCAEASYGEKNKDELSELAKLVEKSANEIGFFYPERVPWCTARVLIGLGACGRTIYNSETVKKAAYWLLKPIEEGGPFRNGIWIANTGGWNSMIETTAMCIIALGSVGIEKSDSRMMKAMNNLLAERRKWTTQDAELDGVLAIEAYSMLYEDWDEISTELQIISKWASSQALWLYATMYSNETFAQSCRIAQLTATLIKLTWKRMSSDFPNLLKMFALQKESNGTDGIIQAPRNKIYKTELPSTETEEGRENDIITTIDKFKVVALEEYSVVEGYIKFDEKDRNLLKNIVVKISEALNGNKKRENYLFWAPPGAGKTFFVKNIAESLKSNSKYHEINLSKVVQPEFIAALNNIQKETDANNIICLIDEIDSKKEEIWPLENLLPFFDANQYTTHSLVWIIAGSSDENLDDFVSNMKNRSKGKDISTRIPKGNIISIPHPSLEDRLLQVLSCIKQLSAVRRKAINKIEKFALFYILMSPELINPRQLNDFIHTAIKRVLQADDRLKYDDLFYSGEIKNKWFWRKYENLSDRLIGTYIQIK